MAENSIINILKIKFKTLPLSEKLKIKTLGRPTPVLKFTQQDKIGARTCTRHFSMETYKKNKWIAGCDQLNALFCFPCVLFDADVRDSTWSRSGYKDLKHLNERMKKHESSKNHLNSCTELGSLGKVNIGVQLNSTFRQNIVKHNEQVAKNRCMLNRIINGIKYSEKFELALRDEEDQGQRIDFSSELGTILKEDLNCATVFKGTPRTIQNEILEAMLAVCRQEIKEQINQSEFLAMQCDDVSDVSNQCQTVMTIRYLHNGNIYERFWSFLKITDCIENELGELVASGSPSELIAQSYDVAPVRLQTKIKNKHKYAHFVHSYAHQLNLIIQKATIRNTQVKIFFANLSSIPSFFSSFTHRCDVLEEIVRRKLPRLAATHWNYGFRTVNAVFENLDKLIECFQEVEEKCNKTATCREAHTLGRTLEDPNFLFWLNLFNKILPHVDILYNQYQAGNEDIAEFLKDLQQFQKIMLSIGNSIDEEEMPPSESKRRRINPENETSLIAKEVCHTIIFQLKERLSYRGHLEAESLINTDYFLQYTQNFPIAALNSVVRFYPMLEQARLKNELEVIYSRRDFSNIVGALNLHSWMFENGLNEIFTETFKLLKIILTTPMPTGESERCFSTLKRVKKILRNSRNEGLDAIAMVSVNKDFVHDISNFDERVMEHFISLKDKSVDFVYRH